MDKTDLKKEIAGYTARHGELATVEVPDLQYLMINGHGDPNTSQAYADALASLYPLSYKLKFFSKRELGRDYTVMPLEALWWAEDMRSFTSGRDKSQWEWTAMILVPDWLTAEHVDAAREAAVGGAASMLDQVRLETLAEGLCVQTLHVGSYDDEGPLLREMHEGFIPDHGLRMAGKHHEIYLSDARRTAPEKLKTILRQPVVPVSTSSI